MKKLFTRKMLLAAILALVLCFTAVGSAMAAGYGVVSGTNSLNLRAAGSSSSQWMGAYPSGTWVEIVGSQNNFYRVITPDGKTGYMSKNYIKSDSSTDRTVRIATVNNANGGAYLNLRSAPSYDARVEGILYNGVPLLVLGEQYGWYYVQLNGKTGYVRSEYVRVSNMVGSSDVAVIRTGNGGGLNLRSGPSKSYSVVRQFSNNQYVMVLAKGKDWWRVAANGYVGFMDADYLKTYTLSKAPAASGGGSVSGTTGTISGQNFAIVNNPKATQALNLRQSPSTSAAVLRKLYNGTELWVTEQGSEWCKVITKDNGLTGYVMTKYIRLPDRSSTTTSVVVHPDGTYVNLRKSQSLNSSVLLRVPHGRQVTVLTPGVEWSKVSYNGTQGYMLSWFLK